MALLDQIDRGTGFETAVMYSTPIGTAISTAGNDGSGQLIPDEYLLTLSAVVAGVSATITVTTLSVNNPYSGRIKTGVLMDGSNYFDIVPGLFVALSNTGVNGDTILVKAGTYFGTVSSAGVGPGIPLTGVRHKVTNTNATTVSQAKARLLTQAVMVRKIGTVLSNIGPFADGATEKVAGGGSFRVEPYVLSISNLSGGLCDLSVDGVVLPANSVRDRLTGLRVSGTGLKADFSDYMIILGPLSGLMFEIDSTCANGDTANIMIFPSRYIQIAPDISGTAGAYSNTDIDLTQSGQSVGVIQGSGDAYFWTRILVPGSSNNESNPYPCNVALTGVDAGSADWLI